MVPALSQCEMPEQILWPDGSTKSSTKTRVRGARLALVLLWTLATAAFGWTLYAVLSVEDPTYLQLAFWLLSTVCFAWVAIGSASALIGFISLFMFRNADTIELPPAGSMSHERTALLFPVYREDPTAVAATIDTMCQELAVATAGKYFDVFILSDTQGDDDRLSERRVYTDLRLRHEADIPIYVRWRTPNVGKKSGNIRDWIENFGSAYPYFIILDADSLMSPEAVMQLASAMDANPRVGLISDGTAPGRRPDPICMFAAVCRRLLRPDGSRGSCRLAWRWRQLLGAQRHHKNPGVCDLRGLTTAIGLAPLGRAHLEPRLRGGGTAAARWMGGPPRSFPPGVVRGMPSDTERVDCPRPAVGAGQSAAPATAQCERTSVP